MAHNFFFYISWVDKPLSDQNPVIRVPFYKRATFGMNRGHFSVTSTQYVLANTTNPGSTIKKKCHSIAYHFVREGCSRDEWLTAYIKTAENIADLLTKPLPSGEKRWYFVSKILHWLGSTG